MRRTIVRAAIAVAAVAFVAATAAAQQAAEPERPRLGRDADPNDWEAYFDEGTRKFESFPTQASAAFYWAARLDPRRAEPLFAQWATFYARDWSLWRAYVDEDDDERLLQHPGVARAHELRDTALFRNPFVHRGFEAALWSKLAREIRWDGPTRAFMDYGAADFGQAAAGFGRVIRNSPQRNARFRYWRALAFVSGGQMDSAAVELTELLAALRTEDGVRLSRYYESKALLEYALGMLHEARGRGADARQAWERALVEDLTMYPARAALARMALRERNADAAVEHMAQVVEIAAGDAVMQFEYGNALIAATRRDDAIAAYQLVTRLEPHWADPYLRLGIALDHAGESEKALAAYRAFLERAPRRMELEIQRVTERVATLQPGG